jgi:S-formylglutathione hydrolase FrmB
MASVRITRRFKSLSLIAALGLVITALTISTVTQLDANAAQIKVPAKPASANLVGTITSGGSRIVTTKVKGLKSHLIDTVITVLPLEYDLPQNAHRTFPYLVMYSGMPGSAGSWVNYLDIATHLEDVEGDTVTPVIAVLVPVYFNYDTECINFKGYPQTGSWIGTDIPKWISATWRVSKARNDHVLAGFSAGGWCAAMQATMNPSAYRAVMTFAGYFAPTFDQAQLLNKDPRASKYTLANTIAKTVQPISFFIGAARNDPISYPSGKYFSKAVKNKAIKITYEEMPTGGHAFSVWERQLVDALDWLPIADPDLAYNPTTPTPSATPTPLPTPTPTPTSTPTPTPTTSSSASAAPSTK